MSALPICCVTGRIAGDDFACGDCDPCGAAHAVPDAVKALLQERDEWAGKYEQAMIELDRRREERILRRKFGSMSLDGQCE